MEIQNIITKCSNIINYNDSNNSCTLTTVPQDTAEELPFVTWSRATDRAAMRDKLSSMARDADDLGASIKT